MLRAELRGEKYVKSRENERVQEATGRSRGSVEHKFMNVSAALLELGLIHIDGYKPERNLQAALRGAVAERVKQSPDLLDLMDAFVRRDEPVRPDLFWDVRWVEAPVIEVDPSTTAPGFAPLITDFVALEAANRSLGMAGEAAVVSIERHRLRSMGRVDLAEQVEHVSRTRGDGLGFDVLSFDDQTGAERFIEVKTTRRSKFSPFYVSKNELAFSRVRPSDFRLYRLFGFGPRSCGLYVLDGALDHSCALEPTHFVARPRAA